MQDPTITRVNRIKGQVNAVERMLKEKDSDCVEVVQQIQAARSALRGLAKELLASEANRCADKGDLRELQKIVDKTFKTL